MLGSRCNSIRRSLRRSLRKSSSTPDSARRLVTALSFSTRVYDALNSKSSLSSWLLPADEDSLSNSCCETKKLLQDNMEEGGGCDSWEKDFDDSGETLIDDVDLEEGKTKIVLRKVDDELVEGLKRTTLVRMDGVQTILSANLNDCPSYVKMDGYIDEDLRQNFLPDASDLLLPSYRPDHHHLLLLLPSLSPLVDLSPFFTLPFPLPPLASSWELLLSSWTLPSHPPPSLPSLLLSGCPPALRPHTWNLLIIRRTQKYRRHLRYADCLSLIDFTDSSRLQDRYSRAHRVVLALQNSSPGVHDVQTALKMASALLPVLNDDEETTFWGLVAYQDLCQPDIDPTVMWRLLETFAPLLTTSLKRRFGVGGARRLVGATRMWRASGMVDCFLEEFVWRLWDVMLLKGVRMVFRWSVAVMVKLRPLLEGVETIQDAERVIRMAGWLVQDVEGVARIVNEDLKGITGKLVEKLRRKVEEE